MGMTHYAYWVSWFITSLINTCLLSLILVLSGKMLSFNFFTNTDFFINFIFFVTFGMSI